MPGKEPRGQEQRSPDKAGSSPLAARHAAHGEQDPQFIVPVPDEELQGEGADRERREGRSPEEDRDAAIEEELEVLRSIYGEAGVVSDRLLGHGGRSCWDITVTNGPWQLQVFIPTGCRYPWACPLLRLALHNRRLTGRQAERAAEGLRAAARSSAGGAFIFSLVEALRDVEEE